MHYYGVRGIRQPTWNVVATISTLAAITVALLSLLPFFFDFFNFGYKLLFSGKEELIF